MKVILDSNMANWTIFKPNSPFPALSSVVDFNVLCVAVPARTASLLYRIFCIFYFIFLQPNMHATFFCVSTLDMSIKELKSK